MRLLFIHGRGQGGKGEDEVRQEWLDSFDVGLSAAGAVLPAGVRSDFPFYGDDLDAFVERAGLPSAGDVAEKGPGQQPGFEQFMQDVLGELEGAHESLQEDAIRDELTDEFVGEKGIQNWGWVRAIARVIDKRWTGAADLTIETFLKDVYLYINTRAVTRSINEIVLQRLTNEPTVVVTHSLGSVVGYNVIGEKASSSPILKHISMGSPLGLRSIAGKLGIPQNLARNGWYNAYDPDDIVALNPLDADHFSTSPPITNNGKVSNETSDQHGIFGYLSDPKVATSIVQALAT